MTKIKDIFYTIIFFAYFISGGIALLDGMGLLTIFPLLAYASAVFGILGGCALFSSCLKKFRASRRRGLQVNWYNSPSLLIGSALFVLGLLPISSALRFIDFPSKLEPAIQLIVEIGIFSPLFPFLLLAAIYRHKEE